MRIAAQLHHVMQNIPEVNQPAKRVYVFSMTQYKEAKAFAQFWGATGSVARDLDFNFFVTI